MPDAKIKQKEFLKKSSIFNLVKNSDLNTKLAIIATFRKELRYRIGTG